MKKRILKTAILLLVSSNTFAQKSTSSNFSFSKGNSVIDLGVGFSGYGLPIHGSFEHFFTDDISAGVALNYSRHKTTYSTFTTNWNFFYGGVKGNYHFQRLLKINNNKADVYAGATIGYWYSKYSSTTSVNNTSLGNAAYFVFQIGGRYMFKNNIGAFAEFGGGNLSGGTVGVSFKL